MGLKEPQFKFPASEWFETLWSTRVILVWPRDDIYTEYESSCMSPCLLCEGGEMLTIKGQSLSCSSCVSAFRSSWIFLKYFWTTNLFPYQRSFTQSWLNKFGGLATGLRATFPCPASWAQSIEIAKISMKMLHSARSNFPHANFLCSTRAPLECAKFLTDCSRLCAQEFNNVNVT